MMLNALIKNGCRLSRTFPLWPVDCICSWNMTPRSVMSSQQHNLLPIENLSSGHCMLGVVQVAYSLIVGTILWDCLLGLECQQKRQDFKIVAPTVTVVTQKQVFHVPRRIAELEKAKKKIVTAQTWQILCMMQTYSMQTYANLRETLRREASCRLLSQVDCATWSVTTGPKSVHAEHLKCSKCWNATGLTNQTCFSRLAPILESRNVRYADLAVSHSVAAAMLLSCQGTKNF